MTRHLISFIIGQAGALAAFKLPMIMSQQAGESTTVTVMTLATSIVAATSFAWWAAGDRNRTLNQLKRHTWQLRRLELTHRKHGPALVDMAGDEGSDNE